MLQSPYSKPDQNRLTGHTTDTTTSAFLLHNLNRQLIRYP